jgi:NADPH:quinone reductase-like Zn-dependent oxidoreductase
MVTRVVGLRPDDVVVATALGSHIGRALLEMARVLGFAVVGTVRAQALVPELEALGAAAVATSEEELPALVYDRTGGKGARAVFDAVGGATGSSALRCLADGGEFVAYGVLSGQPVTVDNAALLFRGRRMCGFWLTRWLGTAAHGEIAKVVEELMPHFRSGAFRPAIDREFQFEDVQEALRYANVSGRHGKVVLTGP